MEWGGYVYTTLTRLELDRSTIMKQSQHMSLTSHSSGLDGEGFPVLD